MPNEPEKSPIQQNKQATTQIHATQLPIDLASKVIVKPANDNTKMIQQPTFRTIQQPPQMRVVRMPTPAGTSTQIIQTQIMPQTILKTSMQQTGRSTITVSKAPTTYLPRVTATLSTIQQTKGGQQIRTPTPPVSGTAISPAFVRASITPRTSSPTAVLSQGTTAWVSGVQVPTQLIRSTITQNRTHIIQPNAVTVTNNSGNAQIANIFGQQSAQQQNIGGSTTISVPATTSGGGQQQQQPTYVATVLPQRPQATIVYTSQQQQPFIGGQVQRMGIANATANTRQVRPIQRIPTTGIRVNTSSLSIRQNVPGLTPTTVLTTQNRNANLVAASTTISNTIPARIFQVATSQSASGSQQVSIGQQNQKILQNVMTLPIIVNNNRITHTVKTPIQPSIIAHVSKLASGSVSSDGTIINNSITTTIPSNTMVASIQANQANAGQTIQVSQGSNQQQGSSYTSQPTQITNLTGQGGSQIITVSQQQSQQLISNQGNIHQQGGQTTVVPLQIAPRSGNIPIKTITVSTPNSASLDANTIHRNLSGNAGNLQATTIMPIAKLVPQQQQQNLVSVSTQGGNQSTPVFIHTRINAPSSTIASATTQSSQVVTVSTPSSTPNFTNSATVYYEPASVSIAPSLNADQTKTTSAANSSVPNNESSSFTVVSAPNVRYSEKMIHSIIANSFQQQQQNANNANQSSSSVSNQQPIRYSPMIEAQPQSMGIQNQSHQIITMAPGTIIQTSQMSQQHPQTMSIEAISANILSSMATHSMRKAETTPVKAKKPTKAALAKVEKQMQAAMAAAAASSSATSSPPKSAAIAIPLTRKQSECDDWSTDGSTTVSIPNSPSPEEDDLDAMIINNQFNNKKSEEDLMKFMPKSATKIPSSVKRDLSEQLTPRKKLKTASERLASVTGAQPPVDVVIKEEIPENNENAAKKQREFVLKKPHVSLLMSYSQTWKPAANHFVRYSDVRARDDRRPSVMDLANQPRVLQRINGWKTYLIKAEIDEVINDETHEMEILTSVLKRLETKESGSDAEKINELIKGNVQRSKLIIDSLNDSKTQLLKIFDHKEHAADIVNRCASKRNFKKR